MATETTTVSSNSAITGGANAKYIHPNISSTISSSDIIYSEGSGSQKMFAAFTSDKGVDNEIQHFTDPQEFIALTGEPNLKKHGQASYNILNFLKSGGEVYGLRVMPDDSGYAHAFLNVLTKVSEKKVRNKDGELVSVPDVIIKPAIAFTDVNNTSLELLSYELTKDRSETETIDGFKNHLLFAVHPTGRGASYNNLGFRITLNESYDEAYDFRVYNFEVIQYDEYGTANIIEGPFYTSLNPDALSSNRESMFLPDVVNTYSKNLRVKYNASEYKNIAKIINPNVNPAYLDILTGRPRLNSNGDGEVFFSNVTQKFEDIHITLHRYDTAGYPLTDSEGDVLLNFIDTSDIIEQSILLADNTYRQDVYNRYKMQVDNMKEIFNGFSNNNFISLVTDILNTDDGLTQKGGKLLELSYNLITYQTNIKNLIEVFNTSHLDSDFTKILNENTLVEQGIEQALTLTNKLMSYNKSIQADADILAVEEMINATYNKLNLKQIIDIKAISKKDKANEISNRVLMLKTSGEIDAQAEALVEILTDVKELIDYLSVIVLENDLSSSQLNVSVDTYNFIIDKYSALFDPFVSDKVADELLITIYQELDALVSSLYMQIEVVIVNLDLIIIDDIITDKIAGMIARLTAITYVNKGTYDERILTTDGRNLLLSIVRQNIENTQAIVLTMKSIVYTNQLQNFNSPVKFLKGNEGSLDTSDDKLRNKTMTRLLARAYSGSIDDTVTSRKLTPFRYIFDANYPVEVKNAIVTLTRDIRKDIFYYADTMYQAGPQDTIDFRASKFNALTQFMGVYGQDYIVYDEYNGRDIRVTQTYFLTKMIPVHADNYGMQYPVAGNTRGIIDGYKAINFSPNEAYKEMLYRKQINYAEVDPKRTRLGSQLTASSIRNPLSNINNVLTVIDIKCNVEDLSEDYQFEFEDDETIRNFEYDLNNYLTRYSTSKSAEDISATVSATEYDKQQGILRVNISVKFYGIIERIVINIDVVK